MYKKGQSSTEYILTIAFVMTIFIPVSVLAYTTYGDYKSTLQSRQTMTALSTVSEHARSVYNIGPPSFSTIQIYFPDSVTQVYMVNKTLTARLRTPKGLDDITIFGTVPISGTLSPREGTRKVLISATSSGVTIAEI